MASSNNNPIQQLLRPPVELAAVLAYACVALIALISPSVLMTTPSVAYLLILFCLYRGGLRFLSARRLLKYQFNLLVLPLYKIHSKDIPVSKTHLYLGLGFEWGARHTQRHHDCKRTEWEHIIKRYEMSGYQSVRRLASLCRRVILARWLAFLLEYRSWINPYSPIPEVEGDTTLHGVGLWDSERMIRQLQGERVAHTFVVGTTRVGKTRLCEVLVDQDIRNGETVIVFDPKGDGALLARMWASAVRAGREKQFYMFHLGFPEQSARYNPVGNFERITEPASRIASQLPGEGNSAAFREFAWRYVNVITKACTALGKRLSFESYLEYGADLDPLLTEYLFSIFESEKNSNKQWQAMLETIVESSLKPDRAMAARDRKAWACTILFKELGLYDDVAHALIKTFEYEKSFYDKLVASLFPLLEKLTSGKTAELLSPNYLDTTDKRPIIDWKSIIRQGGIVYIGLDALSDPEVASAVGASMFSDLTSTAGSIYKFGTGHGLPFNESVALAKRMVCVHADEFNELVGKEFVPMANKAGGANFRLTAYTQTMSDIEVRFGDRAKAEQVLGNLGTLIMLRVKNESTAELLTRQLNDVEVNHLGLRSGTTDSSDPTSGTHFTSNTMQTISTQMVPMIHAGDLTRLPKGQAFAFTGGKLYKIRLPLFSDDVEMPDNIGFVSQEMSENYRSANQDEWHKAPDRWSDWGAAA